MVVYVVLWAGECRFPRGVLLSGRRMVQGVKFTMVSDCCHSGSMLDHPQQQISGNKDPNAPPGVTAMNPMDMLGMFFKDMPVRACSTIIHCTGYAGLCLVQDPFCVGCS